MSSFPNISDATWIVISLVVVGLLLTLRIYAFWAEHQLKDWSVFKKRKELSKEKKKANELREWLKSGDLSYQAIVDKAKELKLIKTTGGFNYRLVLKEKPDLSFELVAEMVGLLLKVRDHLYHNRQIGKEDDFSYSKVANELLSAYGEEKNWPIFCAIVKKSGSHLGSNLALAIQEELVDRVLELSTNSK